MTYIPTAEGWLYLAGVARYDCTRRLVGWAMGSNPGDVITRRRALSLALRQRQPSPGLIHHSDRGVQYASDVPTEISCPNTG